MKRITLAATVIVLSSAIGVGAVRAAGTFDVGPGTVAAGGDVTVGFCGFAAGQGGYYTVNGPSVSSARFWGPADGSGCLTYIESTAGWAPGKYKFIGYVTGSTGRNSKIGSTVVDMLVGMYTGPLFRAALHLWVAAADEERLRPRVGALESRVGREAHRLAVELLGADETVPGVREFVQATLDMARGLGLADLLTDDSARRSNIVREWSHVLDGVLRTGYHGAVS